jgi:hypothetical protein
MRRKHKPSTCVIRMFDVVLVEGRPDEYVVVSFTYPNFPFTDGPIMVRLLPREETE